MQLGIAHCLVVGTLAAARPQVLTGLGSLRTLVLPGRLEILD